MATNLRHLSDKTHQHIPSGKGMCFGIVVAEWNDKITGALREGAVETLMQHHVEEKDIVVKNVPGSIELTFGARMMAAHLNLDGVICLGCVIQGETPHFDYVCDSVTQGITQLNLNYDIPVIYGILTTNNFEQARERAGGKHGNKGSEAAEAAIRMAHLKRELQQSS